MSGGARLTVGTEGLEECSWCILSAGRGVTGTLLSLTTGTRRGPASSVVSMSLTAGTTVGGSVVLVGDGVQYVAGVRQRSQGLPPEVASISSAVHTSDGIGVVAFSSESVADGYTDASLNEGGGGDKDVLIRGKISVECTVGRNHAHFDQRQPLWSPLARSTCRLVPHGTVDIDFGARRARAQPVGPWQSAIRVMH